MPQVNGCSIMPPTNIVLNNNILKSVTHCHIYIMFSYIPNHSQTLIPIIRHCRAFVLFQLKLEITSIMIINLTSSSNKGPNIEEYNKLVIILWSKKKNMSDAPKIPQINAHKNAKKVIISIFLK